MYWWWMMNLSYKWLINAYMLGYWLLQEGGTKIIDNTQIEPYAIEDGDLKYAFRDTYNLSSYISYL